MFSSKSKILLVSISIILLGVFIALNLTNSHVKTYKVNLCQSSGIIKLNNETGTYEVDGSVFINKSLLENSVYANYSDVKLVEVFLFKKSCFLLQKLIYNKTNPEDPYYYTVQNTTQSVINQGVPENLLTDYEPSSIIVTAYDATGSKKYGMCNVTRNNIEKEVLVD